MPHPLKLVLIALAFALGGCVSVNPTANNARDWLNQYRVGNGLGTVAVDGRLTAFAQAQADVMASHDVLSHDVGGSFASRVRSAGLDDGRIAENVAYGSSTEREVMEQWKNSPGHEANLTMPKATRFGIASARSSGAKPKTYWAMAIATDPAPPIPTLPAQGPLVRRVGAETTSTTTTLVSPPFAGLFGN